MSKILSIKGHPTRGNEIIALLEMMGGYTDELIDNGTDEKYAYFIVKDENNAIDAFPIDKKDEFDFEAQIFTLEEFLEKYPYKVGDKVVYTKFGDNCDDYPVTIESMKWTGTTIEYTFNDCVTCLTKDLRMWNGKPNEVISGIYLNSYDYADEVELNLGDYEIMLRKGKVYAVLNKKPKYPTTYKECCDILHISPYYNLRYHTYEPGCNEYATSNELLSLQDKLNTLGKLLICRKAYWKIAGEQMRLDKPWEAEFTQLSGFKYTIFFANGEVIWNRPECETVTGSRVLAFPSEEMRDIFYENFKDLIEQCKELL